MNAKLELVHQAPTLDLTTLEARDDFTVFTHLVDEGARVLVVGCGDGALVKFLTRECQARCSGLELDPAKVRACVAQGLSVAQGDPAADLGDFPNDSFDVVLLTNLQALPDPRAALREAARIGRRVVAPIRNAAHWRQRLRIAFKGRIANWTAPRHACSLRDMAELARTCRLSIETAIPLSRGRIGAPFAKTLWRANWFAEEAVFLLQH